LPINGAELTHATHPSRWNRHWRPRAGTDPPAQYRHEEAGRQLPVRTAGTIAIATAATVRLQGEHKVQKNGPGLSICARPGVANPGECATLWAQPETRSPSCPTMSTNTST
jgi:hypothetical protein